MDGECQLLKGIKNQSDVDTLDVAHLRLGQVDFINCLPINLPIELGEVDIDAKIIKSVPSKLNKMILTGEIDIAPVSSITYLENKDMLTPISDLCIASNGPADSVLLFSKFPIEELDGAKIALSNVSATSNVLLQIILREFLKITAVFTVGEFYEMPLQLEQYQAVLFIGDHALYEYSKMPRDIFIYDLGSLWKKHTGLPMVFGIWVTRKDLVTLQATSLLVNQLRTAKEIGLSISFDKVIKKAQEKILLSKEFYATYFQHLSYDYTKEYEKGLELFEYYCRSTKAVKSYF